MPKQALTHATIAQVTQQLAAQLGETAAAPIRQIQRIITVLGCERAQAFVAEALAREAEGGLRVPDGSRQRTLGGIFFHLVKAHVTPRQRRLLFHHAPPRRHPPQSNAPALPALTWPTRKSAVREGLEQKGVVHSVKITLIGRPGVIVTRSNCVLTVMESTRGPSLPRGLPAIPPTPTTYTIYIAHRHWARVADALANPDDKLIVEGWAAYDPELEGIAVFATFVTTTLTRAQQHQPATEMKPPQ
ncbi:MAG: hypothetical protein EOM24_01545 [Chloroflexia bacterium]|nr:hypothetical protein [Chloroflexia bacterium]